MSIIKPDVVQEAAASINLSRLKDEVASSLAQDAEYRLREIVQEALNFKRHSRRRRLTVSDINNALRVRNVEPLYGFSFADPIVYGTKQGPDGSQISIVEDKELEFDEILSAPLPKAPLEVSFRAHWLAIEGVQPLIPENPLPEGMDVVTSGKKRKAGEAEDGGSGKDTMVEEVLSQELRLYFEKVTSAVLQNSPLLLAAAVNSLRTDPGLQALLPYLTQFITDEVTRSLKDMDVLNALLSMTSALLSNKQLHVEPRLHQLMPAIITCMVGKKLCKSALDPHWALRDRAANLLTFLVSRYSSSYVTLQPRITSTLLYAFLDPERPLTTHYGAIVGLQAMGPQTVSKMILPNASAYVALIDLDAVNPSDANASEAPKVIGTLKMHNGQPVKKDSVVSEDDAPWLLDRKSSTHSETFREGSQTKRYEATRVRGALLHACGNCLRKHPVVFRVPVSVDPDNKEGTEAVGGGAGGGAAAQSADARYQDISRVFGDSLLPYYSDMTQRICCHYI